MYSILKEIDNYIKTNNIPFRCLSISSSYFDDDFNELIKKKQRWLCKCNSIFKEIKNYNIIYDNNDNICLVVQCGDRKTNIVIGLEEVKLDLGFPYYFMSEKSLLEEACCIKKARSLLDDFSDDDNHSSKEKMFKYNKRLDKLSYYILREYKKFEIDILGTDKIDENKILFDKCLKTSNMILDYIDYLHGIYINDREMCGIRYSEPVGEGTCGKKKNGKGTTPDRINDIIPDNIRFDILESYPFVFREYAYIDELSKNAEYITYAYYLGNGKYTLIMEPINGTKYTKIATINCDGELTYDDFVFYIRYYLQLNSDECIRDKTIARLGHTSVETFKANMEFLLTGSGNIKYDTKKKIKELID